MEITDLANDILGLVQEKVSEQQTKQKFSSVLKQLTETYEPTYDDSSDRPNWCLYDGIHEYLIGKYIGLISEESHDNNYDFWSSYDKKYEEQYGNSPMWAEDVDFD